MNEFERFAYDEICAALKAIDADVAPDVYVVSFYVFDFDDDPRRPMLQLGYNTCTRVRACTPAEGQAPGWPIALDPDEAKWNFAFWLQNELKYVGEPETTGGRLFEALMKSEGHWYSDDEEAGDFDRCLGIGREITSRFVAMCVRIVQALHAAGVIEARFGRPIPIIVHELEYYEQIAAQNIDANPSDLAAGFVGWVRNLEGNPIEPL